MSRKLPLVPENAEPLPSLKENQGMLTWVASIDHKQIGIMYLITTMVFFVIGGLEALLMRIQLAQPEFGFISPEVYNQLFTMHGTTMIFFVVMPFLIGIGVYLVPLMIGARDMAFPRLNALSFWLVVFGGILIYYSFLTQSGAPDMGWFAYSPLSEKPFSLNKGPTYWALGLLATGISSVASGLNNIVTILTMRTPGMTMRRIPLFVWMMLVTSFLLIFVIPIIASAFAMMLLDRLLEATFFTPAHGGSAILWQHFFWGFGHPEVYILVLPAFGIISEVIPVFSRKPIFGYEFVAGSTVAIGLLSLGVWAHHMFAVGLGDVTNLYFSLASMLIAIPTGVKVLNWVATMWGRQDYIRYPYAVCGHIHNRIRNRRDHRSCHSFSTHRLGCNGQLFHCRSFPLRSVRGLDVRNFRGDLLLVPEIYGTDVVRDARKMAFLAYGNRV